MPRSDDALLAGALFHLLVTELEKEIGRDVVWAAAGTLSPAQREECIDGATARTVHVATSVALFRAIGAKTGRDVRALHALVIRRSTEHAFATIWRVLLNFTSDEAILSRVQLIFSKAYPGIRVEAVMVGPGHATATVRNWPDMDEFTYEGIGQAIEIVLRLAGRHDVKVTRERRVESITYAASWKT